MDSSDLKVNDITPYAIDPCICLRIIRLWETPSFSNPLKTQTIEMVLIDEENTRIQATVTKEQVDNFRNQLWEGGNIFLSDFMVSQNISVFKYATHKFKITFIPTTTVKEIDTFIGSTYGFEFVSFEDLLNNKFVDNQIVDMIGAVIHPGKVIFGEYNKKPNKRRVIRLKDLSGRTVDYTLWDAYVDEFSEYIQKLKFDEHVVMIMQFGKIKTYKGTSSAGTALFGSKLFINTEIPEIVDFKKRFLQNKENHQAKLKLSSISPEATTFDPASFFSECTKVTLGELTLITKETRCATVATIDSVCKDKPWFYIACRKCTCKVEANDGSGNSVVAVNNKWTCRQCGPVTSVAPWYKLYVRVVDDTGFATFVIFERDVKKLIQTTAYQMREKMTDEDDEFPNELNDIAGQKLVFDFKVTDWNFGRAKTVYTVSKLTNDDKVINAFEASTSNISTSMKRPFIDVDSESCENHSLDRSKRHAVKVKKEKN